MTHGCALAIAATLGALIACGGARTHGADEAANFTCRDRAATYTANKHIGGTEIGVAIDCAENGPRLKRWRVDKQGQRLEAVHALSPSDFDRAWREIDGTGWPNMSDCTGGSLEERDPVYVFEVKDDTNQATFKCQTREVPYPYNDISDVLDMLASKHGQLGDDEPADAKALERKDKNR